MTLPGRIFLAVVVATLLTTGGLHFRQQRQSAEASRLQQENRRLRAIVDRKPPTVSAAVGVASNADVPPASPATNRAIPVSAAKQTPEIYRNDGQATPIAAMQTFAWACDRADTSRVAQLLDIEPAARAKAETRFAALPPEMRTRWKNAEAVVVDAVIFNVMASPFPAADVIDAVPAEPLGDDQVRFAMKRGIIARKTAEGWKLVVTEPLLEGLFNSLPPASR